MSEHQIGDAPIQEEYRRMMQDIAKAIDVFFNGQPPVEPRRTGFVLLVFPFGNDDGTHRTNYISNAQREDVVTMLREQLAHFEGRMQKGGRG